ncbi:MAG TPA: methyltransferase [Flavipsychrobacter sp.]|nr:methyltransferase [Flavipsychrobacter sp.]
MRRILDPLIKSVVRSDAGWYCGKLSLRFTEWLRYERSLYEHQLSEHRLGIFFSDLTVRDGYFKGLRYPGFGSFGSSLFPKLSGSYESELVPVFKELERNHYDQIIDIGCAEGYYAIGLAKKHPQAFVHAFDISENARRLCHTMAEINQVAERIMVEGECTPKWLREMDANVRRLLVCDCEGFERKLFDDTNVGSLAQCDLVVELHPMYYTDVKEYLHELFKDTHHITYVSSYDDARKIFDLPATYTSFPPVDKVKLVQEGRSFSMDWMIAQSNR